MLVTMTTIITGRLSSTIYRLGGCADEPLSQDRCREILERSSVHSRGIDRLRVSLGCGLALSWMARNGLPVDRDSVDPYDGLIRLLLPAHAAARREPNLALHYCSWPLPAGSLLRVQPGLGFGPEAFVTSPALTLRILSRRESVVRTLLEVLCLCGTYALGDDDHLPCFYDVRAATTPQELEHGLEAMDELERSLGVRGGYGIRRCRRASSYAMPNVGSPMEANVFAMLCLPVRLGGFGLPLPEPNGVIELNGEARAVLGSRTMRVDHLWRKAGVGLEYESDEWHVDGVSEKRVLRDKRRLLAARMMGVELLPLTRDVAMSPWKFTAFANNLARRLGKRIRPLSDASTGKRLECFQQIYGDF